MKRLVLIAALLLLAANAALAAPLAAPCVESGPSSPQCDPVNATNPLPVAIQPTILGGTALTGNSTGTTGAVVGTLTSALTKTAYICGFNVQAIGGTATVGPITVAGLIGSSMVFQTDVNSATVGKTVAREVFSPCIPASAVNTNITVTTTANGTATAVDVNAWGFRQ